MCPPQLDHKTAFEPVLSAMKLAKDSLQQSTREFSQLQGSLGRERFANKALDRWQASWTALHKAFYDMYDTLP